MYRIGIDVGSTRTKYCILDDNSQIVECYSEETPVSQLEYFKEKVIELCKRYSDASFMSCGYGRKNIMGMNNMSELSALAYGVNYVKPDAKFILDIGGQDTKIIHQENGKIQGFFLNDKCAAGSGRFLINVLNMLELDFMNLDLSDADKPEYFLSSTCAVFAQSEIVEWIADNVPPDFIANSVIWQILLQAKKLLHKVETNKVFLAGGFSQIKGIDIFAGKALGIEVKTLEDGSYLSALGCALKG